MQIKEGQLWQGKKSYTVREVKHQQTDGKWLLQNRDTPFYSEWTEEELNATCILISKGEDE